MTAHCYAARVRSTTTRTTPKTGTEVSMDNIEVTVRCGYCGYLWCFHPLTVRHLGSCRCGNDNWGHPARDWPADRFGDFDLIGKAVLSRRWPWDVVEKMFEA